MANTYVPNNSSVTRAAAESQLDGYLQNIQDNGAISKNDDTDAMWKVVKDLRAYEALVVSLNLGSLFVGI